MADDKDKMMVVSDSDLDLVETDRLIAALGRRTHCLVVAALIPSKDRLDSMSVFVPNAIACQGIMQLACVSHELSMRSVRRRIAAFHTAADATEGNG